MGIPIMRIYLVEGIDGTSTVRSYHDTETRAKRAAKTLSQGATIKEVAVTLTKAGVLEALNQSPFGGAQRVPPTAPEASSQPVRPAQQGESLPSPAPIQIDPEDEATLAGKSASYIRGWYRVKHKKLF